MGRKKENKSKLAGDRLRIARLIYGKKSRSQLLDWDRWTGLLKIYDESTIKRWENNGLPESKLHLVADCFNVPLFVFTDKDISDEEFRRIIEIRKEDQQADIKQIIKGFNELGLNFKKVVQAMKALESDHVYGDQSYTLKDIFIFQNAEFKLSGGFGWKPIGNIRDYLEDFEFDKARAANRPVVIYGDFGVGKTSFLKMLSSWLIKTNNDYFPIFIPLKALPLYSNHNMEEAISKYLSVYGKFEFNRIDRKILLLLDGFDELNLYRNDEKWILKSFEQLTSLLRYENVHVIISSRPILFLKEEKNIPTDTPILKIQEFDITQIKKWVSRWEKILGTEKSDFSYQSLEERKLISLIKNPLLLYMTAKIFDTELKEKKAYSKGLIFKLFYDWTIRGKFKADQPAHNIPEAEEYRALLQNIAMVILHVGSSDEFIEYDSLKKWIKVFQGEIKETHEKAFGINEIVLVAHFFKIKEHEELKYIEFAHKSFREYLVAEKFFAFFQESVLLKRFDRVKWFAMGRKLPKVAEINFLKDLVYTVSDDELIWLFDQLIYNIVLIGASGNLIKIMNGINFENKNEFNTIYYRSLNLSTLAYIVGNIIYFKLANKIPQIKSHLEIAHSTSYIYHLNHSTPGTHTKGSLYNQNWIIAKTFMSGINLSGLNLDGIDFEGAEIDAANFYDASVRRCSFARSRPIFADFSYAICEGADFSQSYCNATNFTNTYLNQVTFRDAQLYFINFINTEFINVDFSGSAFEKCTFKDCVFKNVLAKDVKINDCIGLPALQNEQWNNS